MKVELLNPLFINTNYIILMVATLAEGGCSSTQSTLSGYTTGSNLYIIPMEYTCTGSSMATTTAASMTWSHSSAGPYLPK